MTDAQAWPLLRAALPALTDPHDPAHWITHYDPERGHQTCECEEAT